MVPSAGPNVSLRRHRRTLLDRTRQSIIVKGRHAESASFPVRECVVSCRFRVGVSDFSIAQI